MFMYLIKTQRRIPIKRTTRMSAKIPSCFANFASWTPEFYKPSSDREAFITSNFEAPSSYIGSTIGFKVIALSICLKMKSIVPDHIAKNWRCDKIDKDVLNWKAYKKPDKYIKH